MGIRAHAFMHMILFDRNTSNLKVDIVPFEKMEKRDLTLNQKELSANL